MNSIPLACDMTVFTATERESHIQNTLQLYRTVQAISETPDGFEFIFPGDTNLSTVVEFISNERKCCPFLEFSLSVTTVGEPMSLALTGPDGTGDFLREEFGEAFA